MGTTKEYLDLISNKRRSVRTDNFTVLAKISTDIKNWTDVAVSDISVGGLSFSSDRVFEVGDTIWLDLLIKPMVLISRTPRRIKTQGEVLLSRSAREGKPSYAVKFVNMTSANEMELDTLIQKVIEKYGAIHDTEYL